MTIVGRASRHPGSGVWPAAILEGMDRPADDRPAHGGVTSSSSRRPARSRDRHRRWGEELGAEADGRLPARRRAHRLPTSRASATSTSWPRSSGRWAPRSSGCANGDVAVTSPGGRSLVPAAPHELVERMRASIVVLGPLLARTGAVSLPLPGGDDFGERPINFHLDGLTAMGAHFESSHGEVRGTVPGGRLRGARVVLEYPSHTATDNLLMAAALPRARRSSRTPRESPRSPTSPRCCRDGCGGRGAGTSRIEIEGVDALRPATTPSSPTASWRRRSSPRWGSPAAR